VDGWPFSGAIIQGESKVTLADILYLTGFQGHPFFITCFMDLAVICFGISEKIFLENDPPPESFYMYLPLKSTK
jgi:hypothetical protein